MDEDIKSKLKLMVQTFETCVHTLHELQCHDAEHLIGMAKLDLQMRLHGITQNELLAFCAALEGNQSAVDVADYELVVANSNVKPAPGAAPSEQAETPAGANADAFEVLADQIHRFNKRAKRSAQAHPNAGS